MRLFGGRAAFPYAVVTGFLMLLALPAAQAAGATHVRLLHAAPGAELAQLVVAGEGAGTAVEFGQVTRRVRVDAGSVRLELNSEGGDPLAEPISEELADGARYTVLALADGDRVELRAYRDGEARPGQARLRAIHAGPELGEPDVRLSGRVIARKLGYRAAAPYESVSPDSYRLAFARPGGAAITQTRVSLPAGTATTGVVIGSGGEQTRVLVLEDDTAAPAQAPDTGLGGLADEVSDSGLLAVAAELGEQPRWALAVAAAVLAGLLGVGSLALASGASRRRRGG
jgi:Domain of unknown function (DUF4397)